MAVDFGGYSFLPPSFFAMAVWYGAISSDFSALLQYPPCVDNTKALLTASWAMVPFNTNNIGEQISLLSLLFIFCLSPPCKDTALTIPHRSSETAPVQASSYLCTDCLDSLILPRMLLCIFWPARIYVTF